MVGTESQMDIAKKSIKETIATIPPNVPVALRVYAHRIPKSNKEGSCKDTELLVPFKPLDVASFSTLVDAIKPNGYTPIAYSLKTAAGDFVGKESQYVLILVSDGEETCGGDPVAEAKNLLAQGFKVTIHTIGFRVDEKTKAQLAAISGATGGSYFDAKDAASLTQNLTQATQKALLIAKPAEQARGQEIRGGNQYQDAVPLQPGIEYHLDHHQRRDQYDYFYVDLKGGQSLTVTLATLDKGVSITSANQAKENQNPYAGFRIVNSEFQETTKETIIGQRHGKKQGGVISRKEERFYILIGSNYEPMHKDSPFQIEIKNHFDGNSAKDAGEDIMNALEIAAGDFPENWLLSEKDNDYYKFMARGGESYTIVMTPQNMEPYLRLEVYDQDRVRLFYNSAPNAGAVVRIENATPKSDGPLYLHVNGYSFYGPTQYGLNIKTGTAPSTEETGVSPTAQAPTTQAEVVAPPTTKPSEKPSSMLYLLVLAGLVIAGLIIVIIVLFFRKKN